MTSASAASFAPPPPSSPQGPGLTPVLQGPEARRPRAWRLPPPPRQPLRRRRRDHPGHTTQYRSTATRGGRRTVRGGKDSVGPQGAPWRVSTRTTPSAPPAAMRRWPVGGWGWTGSGQKSSAARSSRWRANMGWEAHQAGVELLRHLVHDTRVLWAGGRAPSRAGTGAMWSAADVRRARSGMTCAFVFSRVRCEDRAVGVAEARRGDPVLLVP